MANGNDGGASQFWLKIIAFFLTVAFAFIGAPIWIESRIEAKVQTEVTERKEADKAIEARREKSLDRIEKKLDEIDRYIRVQAQQVR